MEKPDPKIMRFIIESAKKSHKKGGHAIAAAIIKDSQIIASDCTSVDIDVDPTYHAEMKAIWSACKILKTRNLKGCYLYTTFEPCSMCTSASIWARLDGIAFGALLEDATETCHQRIKIKASEIIIKGEPKLELHEGFMREECLSLLSL